MKLPSNPILERELKERMRSLRSPVALTVFLALLGIVVFTTERGVTQASGFEDPFRAAVAGRIVFHVMLFTLLLFIVFMVPAFSAGAVSSERERQTFHLVQVTLMRPHEIVLGKLGAAVMYLLLLLFATIPLVSISFVLGGVTPFDVLRAYAMLAFFGVVIAMVGIGVSARARRTMTATVLTYGIVLALTLGTPVTYGLVKFAQMRQSMGAPRQMSEPMWTLVMNPAVGMASAIQGRDKGGGNSPFDGLFQFLAQPPTAVAVAEEAFVEFGPGDARGLARRRMPMEAPEPPQRRAIPIWVWTVAGYSVLGAAAYALAIGGVRAPAAAMWSGRRRRALAARGT